MLWPCDRAPPHGRGRGCVLQLRGNPVHGTIPRRRVMALRPRTPGARALLPVTRCRASGQLGALLSSPVLGVRLMTALQVFRSVSSGRVSRTWGPDDFHFSLRSCTWSARYSAVLPKLSLPFLPAGVGRARGRRVCGGCAGCLWARERCVCVRLAFVFITSKAKLKNKPRGPAWGSARLVGHRH